MPVRILLEALRALRACPWDALRRRVTASPAPRLHVPDELDGMTLPWELPPPPGVEACGAPSATWMPALGTIPWQRDPDVHGEPDLLRRWSRGRLREVLHAASVARALRDSSAAAFAVHRVESFLRNCPPGGCAHWDSGMEIALRAARLLHAAARLREARAAGVDLPSLAPLARALEQHEQALESRVDWRLHWTGNHYLVALAGRVLLAAHLPAAPARARRLERDVPLFFRELDRQLEPAGLHFESSAHYHVLVAECAAHVLAATAMRDERLPRPAGVARMADDALAGLLRPDGTLAAIGDSDDESFVPATLGPDPPPPLRGLEVARALGMSAEAPTRWGGDGLAGFATLAIPGSPCWHATISAAGPGRAGTGGHWHDDAGGYELWLDGPLVVDRGTGAYAADRELRERLRSVRSHAALQVDAREMNDALRTHVFRRRHRAHAWWVPLDRATASDGDWQLAVGHHGFATPPPGAVVLRRFRLSAGAGLDVRDDVTGAGIHALTLRLPWAPGVVAGRPRALAGRPGLEFTLRRADSEVASCEVVARDAAGEELPVVVEHVVARHAPRQGETLAALTTEVRLRSALPATVLHAIRPMT